MVQPSTHENFALNKKATPGSERSFVIVMAAALALLSGINWWREGRVWPWLCIIIAFLLVAGFFWPSIIKPLNRLWFQFGLLLHAVVNPIVLGLVFFGAVWPTGLVLRALGKDPLRLKLQANPDSYWIIRQPPGPAPDTMKDQF